MGNHSDEYFFAFMAVFLGLEGFQQNDRILLNLWRYFCPRMKIK
jgi:hypothetical protein